MIKGEISFLEAETRISEGAEAFEKILNKVNHTPGQKFPQRREKYLAIARRILEERYEISPNEKASQHENS